MWILELLKLSANMRETVVERIVCDSECEAKEKGDLWVEGDYTYNHFGRPTRDYRIYEG